MRIVQLMSSQVHVLQEFIEALSVIHVILVKRDSHLKHCREFFYVRLIVANDLTLTNSRNERLDVVSALSRALLKFRKRVSEFSNLRRNTRQLLISGFSGLYETMGCS